MFAHILDIKRASVAGVLSLVIALSAVQPVLALNVHGNGNAYAYGKNKQTSQTDMTQIVASDAESHKFTESVMAQNVMPTQPAAPVQNTPIVTKTVEGDNGDIKVHNTATSVSDQRNEPKVCGFYLDAFNFDNQQSVSWKIVEHTHGATALSGAITLDSGNGRTSDLSLANGMYKVYWNFDGEHGSAKHKVFKVDCSAVTPVVAPETGQGGGHVLSATSTPVVQAAKTSLLANTGINLLLSTLVSVMLLGASMVVATRTSSTSVVSKSE